MAGSERTSLRWKEKLLVPGNATVIFHTLNPRLPSQGLGNLQWTMTLSTESTWRSSSLGYVAWFLVFSFRNHIIDEGRGEGFPACSYRKVWLSRMICPVHADFRFRAYFGIALQRKDRLKISRILSKTLFKNLSFRSILWNLIKISFFYIISKNRTCYLNIVYLWIYTFIISDFPSS